MKTELERKSSGAAYEKPRLDRLGSVTELTLGMNGTKADPGHGTQTKNG